jgi:citronellol/citronellal dehydrogenase
MTSLKDKVLFITGASRGIGLSIALRAARDGARIAIAAKTDTPHPKLPGTIHTAAKEIEQAGGKALPLLCDIRFEEQVYEAVQKTVDTFGAIDVCINNASAISLTDTSSTPMKRFDLMNAVNARGTFLVSQACIPHLKKASNPHILNLGPPLNMKAKWFGGHVAYSMAKFGMSMCTLGMAEEFKKEIAVNSLWPRSVIATAAVQNLLGGDETIRQSRTPEIMGDAAYAVITKNFRTHTGHFLIDDDVLKAEGVTDFSRYQSVPGAELFPDFFIEPTDFGGWNLGTN